MYFAMLSFGMGAVVGSFLNACIYRIPRDISLSNPKRSFCPNCNHQIGWRDNIPLISYIALGAKCRHCKVHIIPRYFLVELLTAILFIAVWKLYGLTPANPHYELVPIYWLVISGLILGSFVDFEHMIIPDRVTKGGMILGLLLSAAAPALHGAESWWPSLQRSAIGLVVGFGTLYAVAEIGKLLFGKKHVPLEAATPLSFAPQEGSGPALHIGPENSPWDELFWRRSDRWVFECATAKLGDREWTNVTATLGEKGLEIAGEKFPVESLPTFTAQISAYTFPREAMGFGDVKLMGAIGAFFGWPAVLFTLMVSSVIGSLVGVGLIIGRKYEWQSRIPFGPYLAAACLVWMLGGREWWANYFAWITGGR